MPEMGNRDYYLVIDKSGSMTEKDTPTGVSRWDYCQESTKAIANLIQQYDPDGPSVVFFAAQPKMYPNVTADRVSALFKENSPMGGTNLAPALNAVFTDYLDNKKNGKAKANGALAIVVTDGQPNDENDAAKAIEQFTQKLDNGDDEFGISILQVGRDASATAYLRKLDDSLKGAKFDIVDAKTIDEIESIGLEEAIKAALVD